MRESDFRRQLQKGMEAQGAWVYKIPDLARGQLKPCDLIVGYQRRLFLVELKLTKLNRQRRIGPGDRVVSVGDFRPHQLPSLRQVQSSNQGIGWIGVCMINQTQPNWKRAWMLPVESLGCKEQYTMEELETSEWGPYQLQWAPNVGWQVNWKVWL